MSKNSKTNKNNKKVMKSTEVKATKETMQLVEEVKKEVEINYEFDLAILQKMQRAFGTESKKGQRNAFLNEINKKLSNQGLHKLNAAVMKNANELIHSNDTDFVCRKPEDKIFQQLLLLEAKRCNMKAKFNAKGELQPLNVKDISQEILDHYFILNQKFYPERNSSDPLDVKVSKSINFLLYAPLFRESEIGKKLDPLKAATVEHKLQNAQNEYIQSLVKGKISEKLASYSHDKNIHKTPNEDKLSSKSYKNNKKDERTSLINEAVEKLEKGKKIIVGNNQREKIKRHLSKFLNELSDLNVELKRKELVDIIYQELYKNQTKLSKFANKLGISKFYKISGKSLEKIGILINKDDDRQAILKPEVQRQLKEISKQLQNSDKNLLPSEIKKTKSKAVVKEKPPVPKKPKHLKGRHVMTPK